MGRRAFWFGAALTIGATAATRWPFGSEYLFSWDSGNYALAMARIDIAAHRPHPPGYLGYVYAARVLDAFLHNANASLVLWNVIAAAVAAVVVLRMAWEMAAAEARPAVFIAAAASIVVTSPLLWFYSEVAEIYPSELLGTLLIGFTAWQALRGDKTGLARCALLLPVVALFKLTAALLMLPLALYAWWHAEPVNRRGAALIGLVSAAVVAALFLAGAPSLPRIIWTQFTVSTAPSTVASGAASHALERLNVNGRDTLTATTSMLGVVNILGLVAWLAVSRRLPKELGRVSSALWIGPWLVLCLLIHIGKPGYVLPMLPLAALVLAAFYARLPGRTAWALTSLQALANVVQFAVIGPMPPSVTGGDQPYRSKSVLQRLASDMQALTFATHHTIRENDDKARHVLAALSRWCPERNPVVITEIEPVDARRLMWYLPQATLVHVSGGRVLFTGRNGDFSSVTEQPTVIETSCPAVWLAPESAAPRITAPADAVRAPGAGIVIPARTVTLTPSSIVFGR